MAPSRVVLRSTLFFLAALVVTPPYAVLAWLVWPLPARIRYRIVTSWSHLIIALARSICGISYRVRGEVPRGGPYIVMAKHQSAWETLFFQVLFPPQVMVLKHWLLWLPFFGWGLATLSPITVDRDAGTRTLRRLLEQGRARLRAGYWIVVFPEGTRVRPGERGRYQAGGAWLACKTGVAVLPVAHNAGELWPKNGFIKYPGTVTVSIGAPIDAAQLDAAALNRAVAAWIEDEMRRLGHARRAG
jgi:1-acyl-sn-glycerol-3-phosphate acyltransferase